MKRLSMIKRLDTMKPGEIVKAALASRAKKALIVVHPYWQHPNPKFDRFVQSKRRENYAVIVMEYHKEIPKLREKLENLGLRESNSFFIVGTKRGAPDPTHGWQKLIKRIEALGARNVIVSGRDIEKYRIERVLKELERAKSYQKRDKIRESKIRAIKRATSESHGYAACAGITFSKLKASGRFSRVKLSRHFR